MPFWSLLREYWCEHQDRDEEADNYFWLQTETNWASPEQVSAEDSLERDSKSECMEGSQSL